MESEISGGISSRCWLPCVTSNACPCVKAVSYTKYPTVILLSFWSYLCISLLEQIDSWILQRSVRGVAYVFGDAT